MPPLLPPQGLFADATLLDVSEVELADVKFLETDPVVVVQFHCQQINCTRDKFGNVVEGAPTLPPQTIQTLSPKSPQI